MKRKTTSKAKGGGGVVKVKEKAQPAVSDEIVSEVSSTAAEASNGDASDAGDPGDAGLPAGVQDLLNLFGQQLGGVVFPDVSAVTLEHAARELAAKTEALEAARKRLAKATGDLEAS